MDRYYSQTVGTEVFTPEGSRVGKVTEVVIDPETGKLLGFLLGPHGQYIITPSDVLFWNDQITISDVDDILETAEIFKVQQVLQKDIPVLKNKVVTEKGLYLGHVLDFAIHTRLFVLTKMYVAKKMLGLFPYDEKLIAHKNILQMKKEAIIVKNPSTEIPVKDSKLLKNKLHIDVAPST